MVGKEGDEPRTLMSCHMTGKKRACTSMLNEAPLDETVQEKNERRGTRLSRAYLTIINKVLRHLSFSPQLLRLFDFCSSRNGEVEPYNWTCQGDRGNLSALSILDGPARRVSLK